MGYSGHSGSSVCVSGSWVGVANPWKESAQWLFNMKTCEAAMFLHTVFYGLFLVLFHYRS